MNDHHVRRAAVVVFLTLAVPTASGCGPITDITNGEVGCAAPDDAVVEDLMSHARTNFRTGDSRIDHLELENAVQAPLPDELQRFGATHVVTIRAASYFADPASDDVGGVVTTNIFVVDEAGAPVGPVSAVARDQFDLPAPDDPGWGTWTDRVLDAEVTAELHACAR